MSKVPGKCESNGCVTVIVQDGMVRWHSGDTGDVMYTPVDEAVALVARIKAGELDDLLAGQVAA